MFKGRKLLIATKHKKETVLAPLLEEHLGVSCLVTSDFDTDIFGTFSGEKERLNTPIDTLRNKCKTAAKQFNCDLVVASEGSFGPHPTLFFIPIDEEIIMLSDFKNNIEIISRVITVKTNFDGKLINSKSELINFALKAKFPSHGLILKKCKGEKKYIVKGITNYCDLKSAFNSLIKLSDTIHVETDMRALYNPTRMEVIERACHKLIEQINEACPACQWPSFSVKKYNEGLLCSNCNQKTKSVLSLTYVCNDCNHSIEKKYPNGLLFEDPKYCDNCNP